MRRFLRQVVLPILLFGAIYLGVLVGLAIVLILLIGGDSMIANHASGLVAAIVATLLARRVLDGNHWEVGFGGGPRTALRELLAGSVFAAALIGGVHLLILLSTGFRHELGAGTDFIEVFVLFVPAAVHEEILCRGYPFQKFALLYPRAAVIFFSLFFAFLHLGNDAIGLVAMINLILAGGILSLAYLLYRRLWFPIGLHIAWNVFSGPVLGHEVSGLRLDQTALRAIDPGPAILTGGPFGIEASLIMTLGEVLSLLLLIAFIVRRNRILSPAVVEMQSHVVAEHSDVPLVPMDAGRASEYPATISAESQQTLPTESMERE